MHKLNKQEYDKRKAAKDELKKPRPDINSVKALRDRIYQIELVLGIHKKAIVSKA